MTHVEYLLSEAAVVALQAPASRADFWQRRTLAVRAAITPKNGLPVLGLNLVSF